MFISGSQSAQCNGGQPNGAECDSDTAQHKMYNELPECEDPTDGLGKLQYRYIWLQLSLSESHCKQLQLVINDGQLMGTFSVQMVVRGRDSPVQQNLFCL